METDPYPELSIAGFDITVYSFNFGAMMGIFALILLLVASALISGSEVAYFSLTPNDKEFLQKRRNKSSSNVIRLLETPNRLLATILITNNFVNVGIVILSAYITSQLFDFSNAKTIGFIFQVVIVTFLLLLFGEIIPKIYATSYALRFSRFMSRHLIMLQTLFKPLSTLLINMTKRVNRQISNSKQNISIRDLSEVLEITRGSITEDKKILEGIVKFGNLFVKEIMKSRIDVTAIDINTGFKELIPVIINSGYSRIPVFSETFDDIKGVLYVKDLLPHLNKPGNFKWQTLLRSAYFVPVTKRINDLLKEFQKNKIHLAIVIDEYGGTQGIITMEDILEEIVGEITDETDEENPLFVQYDKNNFLFEAKISLNDFYKIVDVPDNIFDDVKGDAETLAGLILELKGEIPEKNYVLSYKIFTFKIEEVDKKRIKKIKVTLTN